ncbi:MAG: Holliday junction branch migration protein RuvA [Alphaproteobacteria bacterium]|nr:Holliday junction branch migration protein RuvA [Alphaproteobacteria bacterium]MCB9695607.1 Holliday junction branch migration protein RuvA [Alphaproteobacteria bacterium]
MIATLRGKLVASEGARGVIDVNGVGWEVFATRRAFEEWTDQDEVLVHVSTQVREDAIQLFGFPSDLDRRAFEVVLGVDGFGPRMALAALDGLPLPDLHKAVESDDVRSLSRIPGVGAKKAQRLALELKGKLPVDFAVTAGAARTKARPEEDKLALALAQLQYGKSEIDRARAALAEQGLADAPLEQRVSAALRVLAGNRG